jgi:hypothetical protein
MTKNTTPRRNAAALITQNQHDTFRPDQQIDEEAPSLTRRQFCTVENISLNTYSRIKRTGHGPVEMFLPGTRVARITSVAHAAWRRAMLAYSNSAAAKLEEARRSKQASAAGKIAAQSSLHISKHQHKGKKTAGRKLAL